jgi:serine/threonine-protein kinase MRCK
MTDISSAAYCDGHLLVYSETHVDIFNTQTGEWVQSIGLKKSRPLSFNGNLSMMVMNDAPYVIYLANLHTRELNDELADGVESLTGI